MKTAEEILEIIEERRDTYLSDIEHYAFRCDYMDAAQCQTRADELTELVIAITEEGEDEQEG